MSFAALHKRVTFLFAVLGFLVLGRGTGLGLGAMLFFAAGTVAAWFAESPRIDSPSWARNLTIAGFAGFGIQAVRAAFGAEILGLVLELVGALQLTRLASRRTSTEHLHVVGLAMIHLLAGTVLTTGLDYALLFVAFLLVTPWMLALTHLRAELEREHATPDELAVGTPPRLARMLESRGIVRRSFLVLASTLAIPLFLATASFFVFFPRVGLGMFSFGGGDSSSVAGFGNSVDLGRFGTIRDDPTVVVRIHPPSTANRRDETFRLRGTSFDRFDGTRWSRTPSPGRRREEAYGSLQLFDRSTRMHDTTEIHLVAARLDEGVVFLPEGTRALRLTPRIESGLTVPRVVVERPGFDFRAVDSDGLDLDYRVDVDPSATTLPETLDDAMRRELLRVPTGHDRLVALAAALTADASSDLAIARRLEEHLGRTGGYRYSLTSDRPPDGVRPLEHFLFVSKRGHCELFASAMAIMLRSRGIPARNVTGFLGGRWNDYGGYYAIVNGDAHSWVEAYVDGEFHRFDPTPVTREAARPAATPFDTLRAMMDALRVRWARDVVGFDMRRQIDLLRSIRDFFPRRRSAGREFVPSEPESGVVERGSGSVSVGWIAIVGAAVLAIVVVFAAARRIRSRPRQDEVERLLRALDRALAKHGLARPATRTPLEHAAFVREHGFGEVARVERIVAAYATARYAGVPWTSDQRSALEADLKAIVRARA